MTSPGFVQRVALAGQATGGSRPQTALTLANSDLSPDEIQLAGGFVQGMESTLVARMARSQGFATYFSPEEKSRLDALGEHWQDVQNADEVKDSRNWLEKAFDAVGHAASNTGEAIVDALHPVLTGFDKVLDAVKLPWRILSSALDPSNNDEIDSEMAAQGYDKDNAWDYVQFMYNQGDSLYHDLDSVRKQYGSDTVDLALEFYRDPEAFAQRRLKDPAYDKRAAEIMARPDWADAADRVDRAHISPGRDVAHLLLPAEAENGAAFTALSGALDAAYTLALDPTLVLGKGARLARAAEAATGEIAATGLTRYGASLQVAKGIDKWTRGTLRSRVGDIRDTESINALFRRESGVPATVIGRASEDFIERLNAARRETDPEEKARLLAGTMARHPGLAPFIDEVNGKRVVGEVEPFDALRSPLNAPPSAANSRTAEAQAALGRGTSDVPAGPSLTAFQNQLTDEALARSGRAPVDGQLVDVNGKGWYTRDEKPIETLEEFSQYLQDTTGLLRLGGGFAAQTNLIFPGRVTVRQRVAGMIRENRWGYFDHSKLGRDTIPLRGEEGLQDQLDAIEQSALSAEEKGKAALSLLRTGTADGQGRTLAAALRLNRARWDQRIRRISTLLPTVSAINLHAADGAEQLRRFARIYLSRGEAERLAAMWHAGDAGQRRTLVRGVLEQTYHASGLSASEHGQNWWARFRADQDELDRQLYGYDGTDLVTTDRGDVHVALYPSQLSSYVLLPSMREMQWMATKYNAASWFSRNVGARFYGDTVDSAMHAVKMGWITTPAGGLRNALDELLGISARGMTGEQIKYRQAYTEATRKSRAKVVRDSQAYQDYVRAHGQGKADEWVAQRVGTVDGQEKIRAQVLEARIQHRLPLFVRRKADRVNDVVFGQLLGKWLSATGRMADKTEMDYLAELVEHEKSGLISRTIAETHYGDDLAGITDARGANALARAGIMPANVRYRPNGREQVELDGGAGIDSWGGDLALRFGDQSSPAYVALKALWEHDAETAVREVRAYLEDPKLRYFVNNAEIFRHLPLDEVAERIVADTKLAVTGRGTQQWDPALLADVRRWISENSKRPNKSADYEFQGHISDEMVRKYLREERGVDPRPGEYGNGKIHGELAEKLLAGELPSRDFLASLPREFLPRYAIKQQWVPVMPSGNMARMAGNWSEFLGRAYKKVVSDQVRAISRNPLLSAKYVTARKNIASYEAHLVEQGWGEQAAAEVAKRMALAHAEQEVIKHIDNPQVASQFSVLARNFWAFERAQEDWLRRWGRIVRDDPTVIRKGQLAVHAGTSAGVVHQDDEGHLTFTYPGSGMLIGAINKITSAIGLTDQVKVPIVPDLTSRLTFLNPSLDNPIGFSATPILSLPFHFMAATMGADFPLLTSSMDKVINGELGAGREWYDNLLPSPVMRIVSGVIREDPASQFGQSWMQAVAQLEAAGKLDELDGTDPGKIQQFMDTLSSQVKNNMVARVLFGLWAPAAPSLPTNDVAGAANEADWSYHKLGLQNLRDEARKVFADLPYEQAMDWWVRNHPNELIFAPGGAGATSKASDSSEGASLPATQSAVVWMEGAGAELLRKYPGVGTFFMPQGQAGTPDGEFSQTAYNAQLEQGIRVKKNLGEYLSGVIEARGERIFFDTYDDYKAARDRAVAAHDAQAVSDLDAQWSQTKKLIYASNPLVQAKHAAFGADSVQQQQRITQLVHLMNDPDSYAAIGQQAVGVQQLLDAYRQLNAGMGEIKGQRGSAATQTRASLRSQYEAAVAAVSAEYPGLADLARTVFRIPA